MRYEELWDPMQIARDEILSVQLGSLKLWIHRGDREWHIASEHCKDEMERLEVARGSEMGDHDWTRWVVTDDIEEITLHPAMPDRPLIVRPEMPVSLLPNQSIQFYIGVPVSVSVSLGDRYHDIVEIPSMSLSKSWFGPSTTEGELCYAMRTTAKLRQEDLQQHPHRVVVPFEIRNASAETIDFTRICLHTRNLRIYQGSERMWTNQARASYRGEEKWSRVVYARGMPPFDDASRLICKARETGERGALLRTFDGWKSLADF